MIHKINHLINENKITTGFFQGDYLSLIDYDFISNIKLKNKYFYLTDDFDMHEIILILLWHVMELLVVVLFQF